MTTKGSALDQMASLTAAQSSKTICDALIALECLTTGRKLTDAEKVVQAAMSDELCIRHPEVDAAADRWMDDLETTETLTEAIVRAALAISG